MSGTQPVAVYAMKVPPGDILVPAVPDFAAMFRVSMAAIDPSAAPELEDVDDKSPPRATLKIVRFPADLVDDSDSEDDYDWEDEDDSEEDEDDEEEENGGPSDKSKRPSKKDILKALAEAEAMEEDDDEDDDDDDEDEQAEARAILAKLKGKAKANGDQDEDDDDDDDDDDESLEVDEVVVCTLDPEKHYQQPLDIVVGERERIFFKVSGTHTVHLTGNYVIPLDDGQASLYDDDEDEYDLSPDEDELDELEDDEESDELDDVDDPRIMEVDTDEEEAPKLIKASETKGKNKRPAEDSEEDANLDDLIAKSSKGEEKLTKSQQKKLKKQKTNDGEAASSEAAKPAANGEKKVQFAKNLEQGPTPSPAAAKDPKADKKEAGATGSPGVKTVQGVIIDDKKLGKGPAAKKGDKVGMRYIGKLENGKVFDSNKKGKPFQFKLGAGDVIKGWDIGIAGLAVGGERRITIPAHLGYGSRGAPPDIPPNSKLIFDVKLLEIK